MRCSVKKLINLIINFIKGLFDVQKHSDHPAESDAPDRYPRKKRSAPWWKRIYNLESRGKIPSTNFQPIKPFGNFKAVKAFYKPKWYSQ